MTQELIIATRKSPLAIIQSEMIKKALEVIHPEYTIKLLPLSTTGDKKLGMPLATIGGKGLFVKELEQALLEDRADIAVHSTKDMPVVQPAGLTIHTYFKRDDPRDAFVSNEFQSLANVPKGGIIGTASLRRQCLINHFRPDLQVKLLRGNVQTRLAQLAEKKYHGIILAAAGLQRQNLEHLIKEYLDPTIFTPAPTQGIMCIECRSEDNHMQKLLQPLNHEDSMWQALAERSLNRQLQGGCQVPIGAYATIEKNSIHLSALVGQPDGQKLLRANASHSKEQAETLGISVAQDLLNQGAESILQEVYEKHG